MSSRAELSALERERFGSGDLVNRIRGFAEANPASRAIRLLGDDGETEALISYGQLDAAARSVAAELGDAGAKGCPVLLLFPPGIDYAVAFLACLYSGAIAVPAYPPDPTRLARSVPRFMSMVANANAKFLLADALITEGRDLLLEFAPELSRLHWILVDKAAPKYQDRWVEQSRDGGDIAFLQYTSGSTSEPKGVIVTLDNLERNIELISDAFELAPETDCQVSWLPTYHDMGLIGGLLTPLYYGSELILLSPQTFLRKPLSWLEAISRYGGTVGGGPNFAYDLCVRRSTPESRRGLDLSSWRLAFNGAEPVNPKSLERFANTFADCGFKLDAFYPCYGLAETTLMATGGSPTERFSVRHVSRSELQQGRATAAVPESEGAQEIVSCGSAREGLELVIVDPTTRCRVAKGEVGEIWLRGPSVAFGYWKESDENNSCFGAQLEGDSEGGYLRTGDQGFLHDGELFVTGRLKDLIIVRGKKFSPQDIEFCAESACAHLRPGCGAAFSVGEMDNRIAIVYEVLSSDSADLSAAEDAVREAIALQFGLSVHDLVFVERKSIPRTSSGKIRRNACRLEYLAGELQSMLAQ